MAGAASDYREFRPAAALGPFVECLWVHEASERSVLVLPDTCVDVIFSRGGGLQLVGTMTRALRADVSGAGAAGVRLHAAAVRACFDLDVSEVADQVVALEEIAGRRMRELGRKLCDVENARARVQLLGASLSPRGGLTDVQRALGKLAQWGGSVRVEDLCRRTGLGARQFRRRCVEECGVGPKRLARLGRFRRASRQIARESRPQWASMAVECGYYDQAHFIREFEQFSGLTPREYWLGRGA